jgi:hypothetical protein
VELVNKVAQSGLLTFDLEEYFPAEGTIVSFDLKDHLFRGLILKEKDFREALAAIDWNIYAGKVVAVHCSADAIIPNWAWMLVAANVTPVAAMVLMADPAAALLRYYEHTLATLDLEQYRDQRVVIKGCSDKPVPPEAYLEITRLMRPITKSIMYGEPCSTVPVFKKKEQA